MHLAPGKYRNRIKETYYRRRSSNTRQLEARSTWNKVEIVEAQRKRIEAWHVAIA